MHVTNKSKGIHDRVTMTETFMDFPTKQAGRVVGTLKASALVREVRINQNGKIRRGTTCRLPGVGIGSREMYYMTHHHLQLQTLIGIHSLVMSLS